MHKYRVLHRGGKFLVQERTLFFFWATVYKGKFDTKEKAIWKMNNSIQWQKMLDAKKIRDKKARHEAKVVAIGG